MKDSNEVKFQNSRKGLINRRSETIIQIGKSIDDITTIKILKYFIKNIIR
jgi:hypothetical protein